MHRNLHNEPIRTKSKQFETPSIISSSSTPSNKTNLNFSNFEISNVESHELNTCENTYRNP